MLQRIFEIVELLLCGVLGILLEIKLGWQQQ